jgi:hypothetical protein
MFETDVPGRWLCMSPTISLSIKFVEMIFKNDLTTAEQMRCVYITKANRSMARDNKFSLYWNSVSCKPVINWKQSWLLLGFGFRVNCCWPSLAQLFSDRIP